MLTSSQIANIHANPALKRVVNDKATTTYIGVGEDITYALYSVKKDKTFWIFNNFVEDDQYIETYTLLSGEVEITYQELCWIWQPGQTINIQEYYSVLSCIASVESEILIEMSQAYYDTDYEVRQSVQQDARHLQLVDGYTYHHCARIAEYSLELWKRLNPKGNNFSVMKLGAYFHDIGKLDVPLDILNKPGKLTKSEWEIIKSHTVTGAERMRNHPSSRFHEAASIVEQHHERYDGKGYPYGLKGDEITLEAAIISVVDAFDAMTTNRVYRAALTLDEALKELQKGKGTQFHPLVVDEFIHMLQEKDHQWK